MKNELAKKLLSVIAFAIAFLGVKYGFQYYQEQRAVSAVNQSIEQLKKDAVLKHPNTDLSIAMQQEAISQAQTKLTTQTDKKKQLEDAASMFMGFFLINTRTRPEFCNEQGIDIQAFVTAFEKQHGVELRKARQVMIDSGMDDNKLYSLLEPQFQKMLLQDMNDISSTNKISMKDTCSLIADQGESLATRMHISKTQPKVYQVLLESQ